MTEDVKNCIEQAERFLVLREHNKNELIDKLKNKKYEDGTIGEAVKFLTESDELNESRYVKAFIHSSNKKHPEGKKAVFTRLLVKKADKELSKQILDEIYTSEYTQNLIENAVKKLEKKGKSSNNFLLKQELFKLGFQGSEVNIFIEAHS